MLWPKRCARNSVRDDSQPALLGSARVVRHPSYTGVLLAFLGWSLSLHNWLSLLLLLVPISIAFARRMNVEEEALRGALSERYARYMQRTKRLLPFIY